MQQTISVCDFHEDWELLVDKRFRGYDLLSPQERLWYNIQVLSGQVGNGGFASYFCEDTAEHVHETIEDLKTLGATDVASLLEKICSLFPNGSPPKDMEERMDLMDSWDEEQNQFVDELDSEFFKKEESLEESLVAYIIQYKLAGCPS